jgi:hypothetical protein
MAMEIIGLGSELFLNASQNARAVAIPDVVKVMRQHASPEVLEKVWKVGFPGQIPDRLVIAEELKGNVIDLEGHDLFKCPLCRSSGRR